MKYRLINKTTNQETICDKVTIDGFDYYVSDEFLRIGDYGYWEDADIVSRISTLIAVLPTTKKVIACTNPNIDIPQVISYAGKAWKEVAKSYSYKNLGVNPHAFELGYNKSQETHSNSDEDMINFAEWRDKYLEELNQWKVDGSKGGEQFTTQELLNIWKEQNLKVIYYGK